MERLTQNNFDYCLEMCEPEYMHKCPFFKDDRESKCHTAAMYDKLREYEDVEQEGRLVVLPCKVGDTVFVIKDTDSFAETVVPVKVAAIKVTRGKDPIVHFGGTYPFI